MQEVVHKCDRKIGTKGNRCGQRVPNDEPTRFSFNGVEYEVDLCEKHQADLADALDPYISAGEPTTTRTGTAIRRAMRGKKGAFTTKDVREWLQAQGRDVPPSGRLANALIEEYKEAMS